MIQDVPKILRKGLQRKYSWSKLNCKIEKKICLDIVQLDLCLVFWQYLMPKVRLVWFLHCSKANSMTYNCYFYLWSLIPNEQDTIELAIWPSRLSPMPECELGFPSLIVIQSKANWTFSLPSHVWKSMNPMGRTWSWPK